MDRVPPSPDSTREATAFVPPPERKSRAPLVAAIVVAVIAVVAVAVYALR